MEGRRVAVLVGCNYKGTLGELRGCVNDVWGMHATLLHRFHFKQDDIQVLVDNDSKFTLPTGANIRQALQTAIASTSGPGDVLFFHFSGHGTRLPSHHATFAPPATPLDYDECIVPCDMNLLTDEDIREVVDLLPQGVTFTIIADSCHSGGLIRYEKEQIGDSFTNMAISPIFGTYAQSNDLHHVLDKLEDKTKVDHDMNNNDKPIANLSRSLPTSTLVEILKKQSGRMDIDITNIKSILIDIFKEEVSIKFRSSIIISSLRKKRNNIYLDYREKSTLHIQDITPNASSVGLPLVHHSSSKIIKENDDIFQAHNDLLRSIGKRDQAILISACQAYETAKDVMPSDANEIRAFGAMSHAILDVLSKLEANALITNYDLVTSVRKLLTLQGISHQHPGLYCCDDRVNATFLLG